MSVYDRWHKSKPGPGDVPCKEHSRGTTKLYPTAEHLRGDRWLVRWRNDGGEQCKRSFPRKSGRDPETCAEAFDAQRHADEARGEWIDPRVGRTPFQHYAPTWMKSRLHKTGTVDTYELHLRNHIMPAFGNYGLAAIRPTMVQQWIKDLRSVKGLAPSTIETIYVIFASIMRGAVRDSYIRKTPCIDIRLPEIRKTTVRLLPPAQILALADAMPQRYALLVLLGAGAGLRQGEAFGLALDRIDADAGMITIDRQVVVVDRRPVLAPPKTSASLRDVPMPRFLLDAVTDHAARLKLGGGDTLCRTPRGTFLRRDFYNREIWKPAITAIRLPADTTLQRRSKGWAAGEPACRPGSVRPLSRADGHPSGTAVADSLVRSTREHRAGHPRSLAQETAFPS